MTKKIPYWHVDAFSSEPFRGNQAAVMVLDEWLPDDVLVKIGAENMFAETAFVVRDTTGEADWELRWCTPTYEIALCGHATLASGHVLLTRDGGDRVTFRTRKSGVLEVRKTAEGYEVGLPAIPTHPEEHPEAASLIGGKPIATYRSGGEQIGYNIFMFETEAEVRALNPDLRALGMLGTDQFDCTAPGESTDVVSRIFVPGAGVDEDSVTGSAHAALTPFWCERLGRDSFTAHQASERSGNLNCRLDGERVWLGGECATVVEGAFYLAG
ncbi:PhzF family phenazine biosynthesis protein [Erythrobacter crassostreae]|uniref:PhzF family phenazine biosynthesis protein n=1 Tax=Erythrobacter crassostreae TaxID=2828328 RepID=A0A9X1JNJ8_9SPHN|nr:PhzF family phenazine biosynthesis protein [Erythrobacter crassostrea]MBV7258502.1 PhzF family phenazine biosynthesis protein [Erythrobacter crassostrea]